MSITSIEAQLKNAEQAYRLSEDNYRLTIAQTTKMQNELHQLQQKESAKLHQLDSPYSREKDTYERARVDFDKEQSKFESAQKIFEKAHDTFSRIEKDYRKASDKHSKDSSNIEKQIDSQENKLERAIERKEQEARSHHIKAENARRDMDLLARRLQEVRKTEMDNLIKNAANDNAAPRSYRKVA